jgi:hypothetical protein
MGLANDIPRHGFVLWPDDGTHDPTLPYCITLDAVPHALLRGAVLLCREDEVRESVTFNPPRITGYCDPGDENDARPC